MTRRIDAGPRHEAVRGLQAIWLALVGSVFFYLFIVILLSQQRDPPDENLLGVMRPVFWILSAVFAIASFVWRQQVADLRRTRRRISTTSGFARLRMACLVTWALSDAVAMLGLLLGAFTSQFADYAPLVTVGIALLFVHRPATWPIDRFMLEDLR